MFSLDVLHGGAAPKLSWEPAGISLGCVPRQQHLQHPPPAVVSPSALPAGPVYPPLQPLQGWAHMHSGASASLLICPACTCPKAALFLSKQHCCQPTVCRQPSFSPYRLAPSATRQPSDTASTSGCPSTRTHCCHQKKFPLSLFRTAKPAASCH